MKIICAFRVGVFAACASSFLFLASPSSADIITYTSSTSFHAALASNSFTAQTLDFESEIAGTTYGSPSTIGQISFDVFGPPDLIVTDDFAAASGVNYLGMDSVGLANQFTGGYNIDLSFASSHAIGFNIITGEIANTSIFDNDIQLVVPGLGTALLDVDDLQATVGGTDSVFFVGLINTTGTFTTAEIRYDAAAVGTITYNIDDITTAVPEPNSMLFVFIACACFFGVRRRSVQSDMS